MYYSDSLNSIGLFRWERLGDIVVLPVTSFKDLVWDTIGAELWRIVAKSLNARRLARQVRYMLELHINCKTGILLVDPCFLHSVSKSILLCLLSVVHALVP